MGEMVLVAFSGVCRFLLESLTDTELKLAYDVHFIQRSFQSAVCSCAAIHLVLMKGISNRSPLSAYRFFHCLQIEQLALKGIPRAFARTSTDDRKGSVFTEFATMSGHMYSQA